MNAAAPPTYAYDIASLSQSIPALPALENLDVNRAIIAGTPIDPMNLADAKIAVKKLRATVESPVNPGVTDEMVDRAELRLRAVEDAHTAAVYAPGLMAGMTAIFQRLDAIDRRFDAIDRRFDAMDGRFDAMDRRFDAMDRRFDAMDRRFDAMDGHLNTIAIETKINTAMIHNLRLIGRNQYTQPRFVGLHKTIPGDGYQRALELANRNELRRLNAPLVPAAIGEQPFTVARSSLSFTNLEICQLIVFYNDDFGIVEDDDESTRRDKLIRFLALY